MTRANPATDRPIREENRQFRTRVVWRQSVQGGRDAEGASRPPQVFGQARLRGARGEVLEQPRFADGPGVSSATGPASAPGILLPPSLALSDASAWRADVLFRARSNRDACAPEGMCVIMKRKVDRGIDNKFSGWISLNILVGDHIGSSYPRVPCA